MVRFSLLLADGSRVSGVIQGAGGPLTSAATLEQAIRQATKGRPFRPYEPKPGHVLMYPEYSAASNGPALTVDIRGAHLEGVA